MIARRCIFFIGGYEPKTPKSFFERLAREMRRFEATWGVETSTTDIALPLADVGSVTVVTSAADSWQVTTDFQFFGLDSIVDADAARWLPVRVFRYLAAFLDYWLSGTAFSIFAKSWRFGLYFLYPFAVTAFFFLAVLLAASAALRFANIDTPALPTLIALLALFPLLATLGKRWSVTHLMDLWSFSREYVRGSRPEAEALMEQYATIATETVKARQFDEIIFVGHSTGGGLILDVAARSLQADPGMARRGAEVALLTLGSTALKFGLHPAAEAYRTKVQSLVDETSLKWAEFQCLMDVINFYKTNPVVDMGLRPRAQGSPSAFPIVRKIHLPRMIGREMYRRIRGRFFRIHYQFVSANTRQYFYDFFLICFGPHPVSAIPNDPSVAVFSDGEAVR
ncbi:lipase [Mesorhizobium sp. KR9-304]|uniref:lipase n=1 Tax=Mesorhizobium sp. KR9-304 TaxID=3156614 RepID=UPI0032B5F728